MPDCESASGGGGAGEWAARVRRALVVSIAAESEARPLPPRPAPPCRPPWRQGVCNVTHAQNDTFCAQNDTFCAQGVVTLAPTRARAGGRCGT